MPKQKKKGNSTETRGRKKVTYSTEELERQPMLVLVCGETGVGKSYRNLIEIDRYMKGNPETHRKGRKVLAFDVNDDDYTAFKTVKPSLIQNLTAIRARRIRPITEHGQMMSLDEKREVVEQMVNRFKNGLLVFDDIDKYLVRAKGQSVIGTLVSNRHSGLDIMISHQSIAKISTSEWENCTWLRLHRQNDNVSRYENRIPNFFLVCIATFIVNEQYDLANDALRSGEIDAEAYKIRRSFYVYVNMRALRIRGASKAAFIRATQKYVQKHENREINYLLSEKNIDGSPKYPNRKSVLIHLVMKYLRHHEEASNSAF